MAQDLSFGPECPLGVDLGLLFARHTLDMHADTPPQSIHMVPREGLAGQGTEFFVLRQGTEPVGMAALKRLDDAQAELKSMHVLVEARGRGLSRLMLDRLIDHARRSGLRRICLETGSQDSFAAARGLYVSAGFVPCPPFGTYGPDPNSVYMTLTL